MKHGLQERDINEILDAFRRYPEIEKAILFGSRAKGNYKPGSDVDIAIKGQSVDHSCVSALSYFLNEESSLPYFFDVVHYEEITETELTEHIDRIGMLIYERGNNG